MKTKSTTCFTGKKLNPWVVKSTSISELLPQQMKILREAVKGDFREDLYHRINEFSIHSPSLKKEMI
jgi:sigma54-dependent transcription regulator